MKDENNFDDFEKFLQSETETQKMFPSDYVWSNISKQIQPKKSWPALTLISSAIVVTLGVATLFNYPPENLLEQLHSSIKNKIYYKNTVNTKSNQTNSNTILLPSNVISQSPQTPQRNFSVALFTNKGNSNILSTRNSNDLASINANTKEVFIEEQNSTNKSANLSFEQASLASANDFTNIDYPNLENLQLRGFNKKKGKQTIEKVSNKFEYEVYTTPSISYRSLVEDDFTSKATSGTVNSLVSQKAGLGKELGLGLRYKASDKITLKTGLQFNIREYYIDAYNSTGLATIGVFQNNTFDSINVASKYSNGSGMGQTRLSNRLYQISIPIGVEWNVFSNKKIGLSIGASMQPTYSLNKNVFIISTDYKYYANGESLFRKWNINSSLSANFTYTHNKSTFFVGPQIRYQHLPTYVDKYPIKEYRVDYGIRLGIIRAFKK